MIMEMYDELYAMEERVECLLGKQRSPFVRLGGGLDDEEKLLLKVYQDQIEDLKYELQNEHGIDLTETYELFKLNKQLQLRVYHLSDRIRNMNSKWYAETAAIEELRGDMEKSIGLLSVATIIMYAITIVLALK